MADDLRSLRDRLRRSLEESVASLSEEATEADFVKILGSVSALRTLAIQLVDIEERASVVRRNSSSAGGAAADALSTRLDELSAKRAKLVESIDTLTSEMAR